MTHNPENTTRNIEWPIECPQCESNIHEWTEAQVVESSPRNVLLCNECGSEHGLELSLKPPTSSKEALKQVFQFTFDDTITNSLIAFWVGFITVGIAHSSSLLTAMTTGMLVGLFMGRWSCIGYFISD